MIDPYGGRLIAVVRAKCQRCLTEFPCAPNPKLREEIRNEWHDRGMGEWLSREDEPGLPMTVPMNLARQGFRCPLCNHNNLLLQLEGVTT